MGHSKGIRHSTRYLFAKKFRKHGRPPPAQGLRVFKLGDIVDIKVNSAVHRGMPFRWYTGKTGVVWNVSPHAVGVIVKRQINNSIVAKRIYVRTEHVFHSRCKEDFLKRCNENREICEAAKKEGKKIESLKRLPAGPKEAHFVKPSQIKPIFPTLHTEKW